MNSKLLIAAVAVAVFLAAALFMAQPMTVDATTANATYIVETDNFTVTIGDNITITDFDTTMSSSASALAESIGDKWETILDSVLAFVIMAFITLLAFAKRNVFLYLLAVPVDYTYGLTFAANSTVGSAGWIGGIAVAIIGTFCLYRVALDAWPEIKAKAQRQ